MGSRETRRHRCGRVVTVEQRVSGPWVALLLRSGMRNCLRIACRWARTTVGAATSAVASHCCEASCDVDTGAIGQLVEVVVRFRAINVERLRWLSVSVRAAHVLATEVRRISSAHCHGLH